MWVKTYIWKNELTFKIDVSLKQKEPFSTIFEKLSVIENASVHNLFLMLKDKKIQPEDTPESVDLKIYDIIGMIFDFEYTNWNVILIKSFFFFYFKDCGKSTSAPVERIKILENDEEPPSNGSLITIILQTQEGRKSRVKFLITKVIFRIYQQNIFTSKSK